MARELFATIEGRSIEAASPLIATGKLAQLANGFLYDEGADDPVFVHSLKIDWLRELVESLDGEPLLIAYEFIEDLRTIRRAFGEVPALGGLTPARAGDAAGRGLERGEAAAARLSSGLGGARAQSAARRVAHGVAVAELVGRAHRAGDRAALPAGADAARDHSRLRRRRHRRRDEARSGARQDERAGSVPAASGAGLMQARTAFRLAMLANGYQPLLNDCKRSIETGWPTRRRRRSRSAVVGPQRADLDRPEARRRSRGDRRRRERGGSRRRAWRAPSTSDSPSCSRTAWCATPAGAKEAWIARVDEPFRRLASRRWYRGSDPDDPAVPKHHGRMLRLARDAAVRDRRAACPRPAGEVISTYQFAGGASPATTPRASLPVLPKAAYALACDLFDEHRRGGGAHRRQGVQDGRGGASRPGVSSSTPTPRSRRTTTAR